MNSNPSNRWSLQLLALSLAAGMIPFFTAPAVANQGDASPDSSGTNDEPEASAPRKSTEASAPSSLDKVSVSVSTKPVTAPKPQVKPAKPEPTSPAPTRTPADRTPDGAGDTTPTQPAKPQLNPTHPNHSQAGSAQGVREDASAGQPRQLGVPSPRTGEHIDIFAPDEPAPGGNPSHRHADAPKPNQPEPNQPEPNQPTDQGRLVPLVPDLWGTPPSPRLPQPTPPGHSSPDVTDGVPGDDQPAAPVPDQSAPGDPSATPPGGPNPSQPDQPDGDGQPLRPGAPGGSVGGEPTDPAGPTGLDTPTQPAKPDANPRDDVQPDAPLDTSQALKPNDGVKEGDTKQPERSEGSSTSGRANPDETKPSPADQPVKPGSDERPMQSLTGTPNPPKPTHPATTPTPARPSSSSGSIHHVSSSGSSGSASSTATTSSGPSTSRPSKPQASAMITAVLPAPDVSVTSTPIMAQPSEPTPATPVSTPEPAPVGNPTGEGFTVRHPALLAVTMSHPGSGDGVAKATLGATTYTPTPIPTANAGAVSHSHTHLVKSRQQPVSASRITQWLDAVQEDLHRRASGQQPARTVWAAESGDTPELGSTWTIRPGDTAWSLARAIWGEDVSWSVMESTWITLVAWNPELANAMPHHLPEGVTIIIPADIPTPTDI